MTEQNASPNPDNTGDLEQDNTRSQEQQDEQETDLPSVSELSLLKDRARLMGLSFSNNISLEKLRIKVNAAMEGDTDEDPPAPAVTAAKVNPLAIDEAATTAAAPPLSKSPKVALRQHLQREQMKLIRLRITNMDPKKKDLPGEIITVANEYIGTVKKYIPFGEQSENGYHVPMCIYAQLESRRFLSVRVSKDPVTKQTRVDTSWAREFALEVLPPLTQKELGELATAQLAAGNS
jgi:hypothetical protein